MDLPPKARPYRTVVEIVSAIVFSVGLTITALAWRYTQDSVSEAIQSQFKIEVDRVEYLLTRRIQTYYNILYALQGLFAASDSVERREWSPFVKTARIADYPDIDYIGYIEVVKSVGKEAFIESFRNDTNVNFIGYPNVSIYPEETKEDYAIVKYINPENEESVKALGFDLYSSSPRKEALDKAADTNQPAASMTVNLATDNSRGFFITAPIYEKGKSINTIEERRRAVKGFVNVVFKISSMFADIFLLTVIPVLFLQFTTMERYFTPVVIRSVMTVKFRI